MYVLMYVCKYYKYYAYMYVKEETNILHTTKRRKANILWSCLLKHVIEGTIEDEIEVRGIKE